MQMQGGLTPPDARDPDAYSDGYERNSGKYALPPSNAPTMSNMHAFVSVSLDRFEYGRGLKRLPTKSNSKRVFNEKNPFHSGFKRTADPRIGCR